MLQSDMAGDYAANELRAAALDVGMLGIAAGAALSGLVAVTRAATPADPGRGASLRLAVAAVGALAIGLAAVLARNAATDLRHRDLLPGRAAVEVGEAAQDVVGDLREQH